MAKREVLSADRNFHDLYVEPIWERWNFVLACIRDNPPDMPMSERRYLWRMAENSAALLNAYGAHVDNADREI